MEFTKIRPQVEQLSLKVELGEKSGETGRRRFRMLGYTGAEVARLYGRAVFDVDGIEHKAKVPILLNHDETAIAGYADTVSRTDSGLELSGFLTESTEHGRMVAALSDEGFPWEASVGLQVNEWRELGKDESLAVNGRDVNGPVSVGTKSRLLEVSFVTAGADKSTHAVALAAAQNQEVPMSETDSRQELAAFLEAFPGREGWAAKLFAAGKTVAEAKEDLAAVLAQELEAAKADLAKTEAARDELSAKLAELEALKTESRHPGVGFSGEARDANSEPPTKLSAEQRWETDAELRHEFFNSKSAYMAFLRRHPEEA